MAKLILEGFNVNCVENEGTWLYEIIPGILTTNKNNIIANNIDIATISAEVPNGSTQVDFIINNSPTTKPVTNNIATLEFKTSTVGTCSIRVGNETVTKYNEVTIIAE